VELLLDRYCTAGASGGLFHAGHAGASHHSLAMKGM
jgi:hypothetical protein